MKQFIVTLLKFFFIFVSLGLLILTFFPIAYPRVKYLLDNLRGKQYEVYSEKDLKDYSAFGDMLAGEKPLRIIPESKDFGIVIEKINLNAPIVANVSMEDEYEYKKALKLGVAHARGTAAPGQGNTYLFAHSSLDFWELGKYATVFNLLDKLKEGDRVIIFYKDERYDYVVTTSKIVKDWETSILYEERVLPTLFMQTCTPPGTTLNRLIVEAELSQRQNYE